MALFLSRHVRTFSVICQWGCEADLVTLKAVTLAVFVLPYHVSLSHCLILGQKSFSGKVQLDTIFLCFNLAFDGVLFNLFPIIFPFHFFARSLHNFPKRWPSCFLFSAIRLFTSSTSFLLTSLVTSS